MPENNHAARRPHGLTLAIAALALGVSTLALQHGAHATAQNGSDAVKTRIAVVDIQRVFNALDEIDVEMGAVQRRVDAQIEEFRGLIARRDQLQTDLTEREMPPSERNDMLVEVGVLAAQIEATQSFLQQRDSAERGDVLSSVFRQIVASVNEYAEREGFDVVLHDDTSFTLPGQGFGMPAVLQALRQRDILYRSDALDITDRIISEMNARYNAGG
jgi:Skp family chaperone for outer membrane proteins